MITCVISLNRQEYASSQCLPFRVFGKPDIRKMASSSEDLPQLFFPKNILTSFSPSIFA